MQAPQFDEDLNFVQKMWLAERIGWLLLAATLLAAVLGAFGQGLFSTVQAAPRDSAYTLTYNRFERMQSPVTLRLLPGRSGGGSIVVWISASYLDRVSINDILPQPESMTLGADRVLFRFATTGGPSAAAIRFNVEGDSAGPAAGELGVDDAEAVPIRQFFYP